MKKIINTTEVNGQIGGQIVKTTNFLKKLSDYIENKLYDENGEVKNSGVRSLSLTFAMLVGFSTAILIVSSIFIGMIIMNKNEIITEKSNQIRLMRDEIKKESKEADYWEKKYNNVYSKCDSLGYERARQALEFSQSINNRLLSQKKEIINESKNTKSELNSLKQISNEIAQINNYIK